MAVRGNSLCTICTVIRFDRMPIDARRTAPPSVCNNDRLIREAFDSCPGNSLVPPRPEDPADDTRTPIDQAANFSFADPDIHDTPEDLTVFGLEPLSDDVAQLGHDGGDHLAIHVRAFSSLRIRP